MLILLITGSSPRWRGTRVGGSGGKFCPRIIPALAGNTVISHGRPYAASDHPRAGGEHIAPSNATVCNNGSSPRWRGTPLFPRLREPRYRIIPALAGNTNPDCRISEHRSDHPRAGGEHPVQSGLPVIVHGSSPRWRGTLAVPALFLFQCRIIPALAGNTPWAIFRMVYRPDHPRAGGEHVVNTRSQDLQYGSSPRWRGTLSNGVFQRHHIRIIPALAGNTL